MKSISIIGCGFVGLSLAVFLANNGIKVIAVDVDKIKIKKIRHGVSPFYEPGIEEELNRAIRKGMEITSDINYAVTNSDITFVTVGTPSKNDGSSNFSFIRSVSKNIGCILKRKKEFHIVIIKSTVVPKTTNNLIKKTLEKFSCKKEGKHFGLAMNPEFLREGSAVNDTANPHLIVTGANNVEINKQIKKFYESIYKKKCPDILETSIENAEMIKYANNAFLATKISFINSIANICQKVPNSNVNIISKAIGKDPRIGPLFLQAGPGYGGSCFPKDVKAIINFSKKIGYNPILINATHQVNDIQTEKVLDLVKKHLKIINGKTITILGLSFKKDTDDLRESISLKLIPLLIKKGSKINVHDPMAMENAKKKLKSKVQFHENIEESLKNADCAVVMTDWDEYKKINSKSIKNMKQKIIIDTRRILTKNNFDKSTKIIALGIPNQS